MNASKYESRILYLMIPLSENKPTAMNKQNLNTLSSMVSFTIIMMMMFSGISHARFSVPLNKQKMNTSGLTHDKHVGQLRDKHKGQTRFLILLI